MSIDAVPIHPAELSRLDPIVGEDRARQVREAAREIGSRMSGRAVINVNSTGKGGGVAEMLLWFLGYIRGAGIDARWYVVGGTPGFFRVTKRLHNMLHGDPGDGGSIDAAAATEYDHVVEENAGELRAMVSEGDVVVLHDPQTAGMVHAMKDAGATVIWRCHIGTEKRSELTDRAWAFLRPHVEHADAFLLSRREYVPGWMDREKVRIVPPSIDPFATKNRPMSAETARAILAHTGILRQDGLAASTEFVRSDDSIARVNRMADIVRTGPGPGADTPLVVQVSRWDRLKDMAGVMHAFSEHVDGSRSSQLVLAGPVVTGVADDPEGGAELTRCIELWRELSHFERSRIQLVCIPMTNIDENAAIVNALQTHARVVVQKSLAEGFGLTVTEAMWKSKPVVASALGGISDQIVHGESGLLVRDPTDPREFGEAVQSVLDDDALASRLSSGAKARVQELFLGDRHLLQYADLFEKLDAVR